MRLIVLFVVILGTKGLYAQNWDPIPRDSIYFIQEYGDIYSSSKDSIIWSIIVKDRIRIGKDSIIVFGKKLNKDSIEQNIFNPNTKNPEIVNIWGDRAVLNGDSISLINYAADTLVFAYTTKTNGEWRLLSGPSQSFFVKVDSISSRVIDGNVDSIKHCRIICKDGSGNIIPHVYSGETFRISKRHGFLTYVDWFNFPLTANFLSDDSRSFINLGITRRQMFDYYVGDRFQIETKYVSGSIFPDRRIGFSKDFEDYEILAKWYSSNKDTVFYEQEQKITQYRVLQLPSPTNPNFVYDTIFTIDTVELMITDLDDHAISAMTEHFLPIDSLGAGLTYCRNYDYGGRTYYSVDSGRYYFDTSYAAWTGPYKYYKTDEYHVIEGVGAFYEHHNYDQSVSHSYHQMKSIVYYKSGVSEWGTKRIITGLKNSIEQETNINIYPNPVVEHLNVQIGRQNSIQEINLYDLLGKEQNVLMGHTGASNFTIDLSDQQNGIYLLKIQLADGNIITKKIIKE